MGLCCLLVYYDFKSTCLWLEWSCFNLLVHDKDQKKSCFRSKLFWYQNEGSCVRLSSSNLLSLTGTYQPAAEGSTGGLAIRTRGAATVAKGHLDYKYREFVMTFQELRSGQATLCWPKQLSKDLETLAPVMAKATQWAAVLNPATVPGVITREQPSLSADTGTFTSLALRSRNSGLSFLCWQPEVSS